MVVTHCPCAASMAKSSHTSVSMEFITVWVREPKAQVMTTMANRA